MKLAGNISGVYTAIVTPFTAEDQIDWEALERLIARQLEAGIDGIVPCGTTGESPTLTEREQLDLIKFVVQEVSGKAAVFAGTGSNSTRHAVHLSKQAEELGADGCLVVSPYYNKPTQEGLFRHFTEVARQVGIPVMLYNIKGRTGVNVETETLLRIIESTPNVSSVKEASGDMNQIQEVIRMTPDDFVVMSGDDGLTAKVIAAGGDGVVSVASNLIPQSMLKLVKDCCDKRSVDTVYREKLERLFEALFIETNPIPIKAALAQLGYCQPRYRLPLCEMRTANAERLLACLSTISQDDLR